MKMVWRWCGADADGGGCGKETKWLRRLVTATTSRHRLHDVSVVIWCVAVAIIGEGVVLFESWLIG